MIRPLFWMECKSSGRLLGIFAAVLSLYIGMIVAMFDPELGESLNQMAQSMPEIFAAFNMSDAGSTLVEFVSNYLFGFLLIVLPLVFLALLSVRLVARKVERGSMACLLAAPHSRRAVIATQAAVQLCLTLVLAGYACGLIAAVSGAMFPGELEAKPFWTLSAGLVGLLIFLGGVCFCASCLFDTAGLSAGVGAGLCVLFVLVQMLSQVSSQFDWLMYCTPLTLFDREAILAAESGAVPEFVVLYLAGAVLYLTGGAVFTRRDLPV